MSIKSLPPMEHTFTINVKGDDTSQVFDGTFTYKRPNLRAKSEIAKTTAMLNGGMANLDEDAKFLHNILATLKHTLVKSPEWWQKSDFGFELYDENVIFSVYKACGDFEKSWLESVWAPKEEKEEKK